MLPGAAALPEGKGSRTCALRLRAHTRPPRKGEKPLAPGSGSARIDRVNRLFGLGADDMPATSVFEWTAGADITRGLPLELVIPALSGCQRGDAASESRAAATA